MNKITTVCYGKEDTWETKEAAEQFFLQAMMGSDGSERDRYTNIYIKLQMGITEFAEKCGMEEGRLERILHSRGRLTPAEAVQIAAAFGQTMEEAFDIEPLPMDEVREMENTEFHKMVTEHLNTIAKIHKTTPAEFAEQCGLKERRVKNLLDGTARMSVVEAVKIADGFNVSLDYLLGYYPYPLPTPKTEEQVRAFEAIGKMSLDELAEFAEKLKEELPQEKS